MKIRLRNLLSLLALFFLASLSVAAQTNTGKETASWPREVISNGIKAEIYQPQLDSWNEVRLQTHAAMAVTFPGSKEPVYGVILLDVTTQIDRAARVVHLTRVNSLDAKFPSAPEQEAAFIAAMKSSLLKKIDVIALDRLEADLEVSQAERQGQSLPLKNSAPTIIFSSQPALLVYVDGEPHWQAIQGTPLKRVLNTRVLLLQDASQRYYLHFLDGYLTANSLKGPWTIARSAPAGSAIALKQAQDNGQTDLMSGLPDKEGGTAPSLKNMPKGKAPEVFIQNEAAELIVFDGTPNYVPIEGTNLLYVKNTTANVFKNMGDQQSYVLLSGRWFRANSLNGPWLYVEPKNLPADFAKIPDSSVKENVKASIPGTPQARESVIANEIPQTAQINRQTTHFKPSIDGGPQMRPIDGTPLQYVFNAADPIIQVDAHTWYALQNAVWFVATDLKGPWVVAEKVPAVIYAIPASSPLHYVTYVKVYESSPSTIVVGYTPGYYGTITTTDGIVVYGTGYAYTPWIGSYWYGPPMSYGVGISMGWTPWGGWAFGFGFGWGWGYPGMGWWYPPAPWWGPYWGGGYYHNRYGGMTAWGPGGWAGTTGNIYNRWGNVHSVQRGFAGYNAFTGNRYAGRYGMAYNSVTGTMAAGRQGAVQNVFTGNYAKGGQFIANNPGRGVSASGGRVTVGNSHTGNSVTRSHVKINGQNGNDVNAGRVTNQQGSSVEHIGNNMYGTKDGKVYRYDANNSANPWQPMSRNNGASSTEAGNMPRREPVQQNLPDRQQLDLQRQGREQGSQRAQSFNQHGSQFSRPSEGFAGRGGGGGRFGGGFRR